MHVIAGRELRPAERLVSAFAAKYRAAHTSKKDPEGAWACRTKKIEPLLADLRANNAPPGDVAWPISEPNRADMIVAINAHCARCGLCRGRAW